jgi:hypothetical protein
MEYLLVNFHEERDIMLDGEIGGLANHLITLARGLVTVSLAPPRNFSPRETTVMVRGTSPLAPMEVDFE